MFRYVILLSSALLVLTSCATNNKEEDLIQPDEDAEEQELSIIPSHTLSSKDYKIILPYQTSKARGAITNQISNRLDIDEVEQGLRRHSIDVFDPEKYFFEEGQYLSTAFIYDLIDDLNPTLKDDASKETHEKNPRYLSHILEQNYLKRNEDDSVSLAGVSIGIALKSVYQFHTEKAGPYFHDISQKEMLAEGKEIAEQVVKEIREVEGLNDVPIMLALYREEEQSSPVPGNFVTKTTVSKGDTSIGKWEDVNEKHVLFPSSTGKEKHYEDYQKVKNFGDEISDYFPNYVGVIGEGFYVNQELTKLTLEIPIEFYGKGEVIGFTQYAYGLVKEIFPDYFDLEVKVKSSEKMESLIYRKAGTENPEVHILN